MANGFGGYNYWDKINMAHNYANFDPPLKIRKLAQLQETRIFTCNPIENENTHHELPKDIYNPKQDRKIWVIKICCFPGIIVMQHFCKMTSFA